MTQREPLYENVFWVRAKGLNYSIRLPVPQSNVLIHFLPDIKEFEQHKSMPYVIKVKLIFCELQKSLYCGTCNIMGAVGLRLNESSPGTAS